MEALANGVLRICIHFRNRAVTRSVQGGETMPINVSHRHHYSFGVRVRVAPQLRSVLALGQRRYFQLRMHRSSVSIVQSNGLQREIRSARFLEIQEIMVPGIVDVVLLPRVGVNDRPQFTTFLRVHRTEYRSPRHEALLICSL